MEGKYYHIDIDNNQKYIVKSQTKMLNTKTFPLSSLSSFNLFGSALSQPFSQLASPYIYESILRKKPKIDDKNYDHLNNQQIINSNNMTKQVKWFNTQMLYEAIVKIILVFYFSFVSYMLGICTGQVFLCLVVISFLYFGLQHNIFGCFKAWAKISLFGSTFVLVNQIFLTILHLLSSRTAETLYSSRLVLIQSLLITLIITFIYQYKDLLMNSYDLGYLSFRNILTLYPHSLLKTLRKVYQCKSLLLPIYGISFLCLYVLVVFIRYENILINGRAYIALLHPMAFLAQFVTIMWIVVVWHLVQYLINVQVFWRIAPIFCNKINRNTNVPVLVQLLKLNPSQKMYKQLQINNLLPSFRVFSSQQTKIQNKIAQQDHNEILKHSLSWLISKMHTNDGNSVLRNKMHIYNTVGCSLIGEIKHNACFFDYLLQFAVSKLSNITKTTHQFQLKVQQLQIRKDTAKQLWQDVLFHPTNIIKQWNMQIAALKLVYEFNICDYLFEIIALSQIDLSLETGKSADLLTLIQQVNVLSGKLMEAQWLSQIIRTRIQSMYNKSKRILTNARK